MFSPDNFITPFYKRKKDMSIRKEVKRERGREVRGKR
jgi:hypothetical protein